MLTSSGSPLVSGARLPAMPQKFIRIVVTRPFLLGGVRQELGTELDVEPVTAAELVTVGKAAKVPAPQPAGGADASPQTKPAAKRAAKEPQP